MPPLITLFPITNSIIYYYYTHILNYCQSIQVMSFYFHSIIYKKIPQSRFSFFLCDTTSSPLSIRYVISSFSVPFIIIKSITAASTEILWKKSKTTFSSILYFKPICFCFFIFHAYNITKLWRLSYE